MGAIRLAVYAVVCQIALETCLIFCFVDVVLAGCPSQVCLTATWVVGSRVRPGEACSRYASSYQHRGRQLPRGFVRATLGSAPAIGDMKAVINAVWSAGRKTTELFDSASSTTLSIHDTLLPPAINLWTAGRPRAVSIGGTL